MFDIGAPELFIVAVLAIIVVGPKDLPKLIRSVMGVVRKVREMGGEFQAGMKKMADEVELDAVTRKLNEAGNIDLESTKPDIKPAAEYDEFDYDEYDYDGGGGASKSEVKKSQDVDSSESTETRISEANEVGVDDLVSSGDEVKAENVTAKKNVKSTTKNKTAVKKTAAKKAPKTKATAKKTGAKQKPKKSAIDE